MHWNPYLNKNFGEIDLAGVLGNILGFGSTADIQQKITGGKYRGSTTGSSAIHNTTSGSYNKANVGRSIARSTRRAEPKKVQRKVSPESGFGLGFHLGFGSIADAQQKIKGGEYRGSTTGSGALLNAGLGRYKEANAGRNITPQIKSVVHKKAPQAGFNLDVNPLVKSLNRFVDVGLDKKGEQRVAKALGTQLGFGSTADIQQKIKAGKYKGITTGSRAMHKGVPRHSIDADAQRNVRYPHISLQNFTLY